MWDTGNLYPQKFCLKKMFLKGVYVNWPSCLSRFSIWPEGLNPISFFTYLTKARLPQNNPGMQFYFRRWILLYSFFVLFWLSMLSIWFETKENWRENYRLNHRQKNAISIINIIIHDTVFIYAIIVFLAEVCQVFSILLYSLSFFLGWGLEKPMQKICQRKKTLVPDCFSQKRPRHNLSNPNDLVTGAGCIPTTILLNLGATIWRHSG